MLVRSANFKEAYLWVRWFVHIGAIMIPILFFYFVVKLLKARAVPILTVGYASAAILGVLDITGRLVSVHPQQPFNYYSALLPLYPLLLIYFFGFVLYGHALLLRQIWVAESTLKKQLAAVFIGTSIGFIGGSTTF